MVSDTLAYSETTPLVALLGRASYDGTAASSITAELSRDLLAARKNTFTEVAGSIHAFRPAMIDVAISASLPSATPAEIDALVRALEAKIASTSPHSSDIEELARSIAKLRKARQ